MPKPTVVITRRVPDAGPALLPEECEIDQWESDLPIPRDVLLQKIGNASGIFCLLTEKIDAELLDAAGQLKVVSNMAVGYDNVDVAECTRRGIPVGNTPGVLTETTADFAFTLLCAAARRVVEAERYVREGRWVTWGPLLMLGQDVHGATLGLIGLGRIGSAVARRARGFGMRVLYSDPVRNERAEADLGLTHAPVEAVLNRSDFVSLHTPLTPETRHLINADTLRLMRRNAVLINTSRGAVVDTDALYLALRDGVIGGAALDVTDPEPLPISHPLYSLPNGIIVPHIASASVATRNEMSRKAARNLLAGLRGERLPNCVNPQVYGPE